MSVAIPIFVVVGGLICIAAVVIDAARTANVKGKTGKAEQLEEQAAPGRTLTIAAQAAFGVALTALMANADEADVRRWILGIGRPNGTQTSALSLGLASAAIVASGTGSEELGRMWMISKLESTGRAPAELLAAGQYRPVIDGASYLAQADD